MPGEKVKFDGLRRIGKKEESKQQPILITVTDKKTVYAILKNKNKLRNEDNCRHVYIEKDLTEQEQKEQYDLRCELKERRRNGEQCIINKNRIVKINPGTEQLKEEDDDKEEVKTTEDLSTTKQQCNSVNPTSNPTLSHTITDHLKAKPNKNKSYQQQTNIHRNSDNHYTDKKEILQSINKYTGKQNYYSETDFDKINNSPNIQKHNAYSLYHLNIKKASTKTLTNFSYI